MLTPNPQKKRKVTLGTALLWSVPLSLLSSLGAAALASTLELDLLPTLESAGNCPETLTAHETPRPFVEGGFSTDGMIKLREIATGIRVLQSDLFSTTWVGTLKPEYRNCQASAIISTEDGEAWQRHSYLRVQLANGQARATLDMTGIRDANGFTTSILFGGMRDGNPRWTWGGSD
ncbi:MAG TPA: hypothetical protein V6D06_11060 [Trichocoleus sp.]